MISCRYGPYQPQTGRVLYRSNEFEVQGVNVELGAALEKLFHHKLHIQQTLERVQRHVESVKQDIAAATM